MLAYQNYNNAQRAAKRGKKIHEHLNVDGDMERKLCTVQCNK